MHADVLIIGGGIIGLSIAYQLKGKGADICLIDAGKTGGGTTYAAAGMLCPGFELSHVKAEDQPAFHDFAMQSLSLWPGLAASLEEETGQTVDLRLEGALGLYDESQGGVLDPLQARLAALGRPVQRAGREDIAQLQPGLSGNFESGLFLPDEGQIDPRKTAAALRRAVESAGVRVIEGEGVDALVGHEGQEPVVVTRSGERLTAGHIVLAAGLAARDLWQEVSPAPLFSVKGQALSLDVSPGHGLQRVIRTSNTYLCPKAGDRIVLGATEEAHVETLKTEPQEMEALRQRAVDLAPVLGTGRLSETWAGLRPTTPDKLPVIGRSGTVPSVIYACGHYRNGILLAPVTAKLVADLIDGKQAPRLTAPDRF